MDNFCGQTPVVAILTAMPPTSFDSRRPFTRAAGRAAGITDAMLRGPRFRSLFRNVHIRSDVVVRPTLYIEAALLLHPVTAFASHHSAATLYGLPVPDQHPPAGL